MNNRAGSVTIPCKGARLWRFQFDGDPIEGKRRLIGKAGFETRGAATEAMRAAMDNTQPARPCPQNHCQSRRRKRH